MTATRKYQIEIEITVDDEDADLLTKLDAVYNSGQMVKRAQHAAINSIYSGGYNGLHRVVLARQGITYGKGFVADHADNNNANNTRKNLRVVTTRQNILTGGGGSSAKQSMYMGVTWSRGSEKWTSQVGFRHNGKGVAKNLGLYDTEIKAAEAYDDYLVANGIDKPLNFPTRIKAPLSA